MKIAHVYARYSLRTQGRGDSLRRQIARAEAYARSQGWILAQPITDLGVSAFKSRNLTEGALGEFLAAVEAGKIPAGCVLIVESLDRLSRNTVTEQFLLLLRIVKAGIELVTLMDEKRFTRDSINASPLELIVSLAIMIRAHDESLQKSRRISAAWQYKRLQAANRKLTARCPPWLEASPDRTKFIVIQSRAFAVKEMFRLATAGYPPQMILDHLANAGCEAWGRQATWTLTKILDVLHNRAVLGEFQPHRMADGKRVPDGEPIADYFPAIISPAVFTMAQRALRFDQGPRQGDANLFVGLAWDGQTGEPMVKRNEYMVNQSCDRGGPAHRWAYRAFEQNLLCQLEQLDWASMLTPRQGESEVNRIEAQIDEQTVRLDHAVQRVLAGDPASDSLAREIKRWEQNRTALVSKLAGLRKLGKVEVKTDQSGSNPGAALRQLISKGDTTSRLRLRLELRLLIDRIELWPRPDPCHKIEGVYPRLQQKAGAEWGDCLRQWPYYRVVFADDRERWVVCQRASLKAEDLVGGHCRGNGGISVP